MSPRILHAVERQRVPTKGIDYTKTPDGGDRGAAIYGGEDVITLSRAFLQLLRREGTIAHPPANIDPKLFESVWTASVVMRICQVTGSVFRECAPQDWSEFVTAMGQLWLESPSG